MHRFFDVITLALIVAIIFLFVRPGSLGPSLVEKIAAGTHQIFGDITGGGGWWGK